MSGLDIERAFKSFSKNLTFEKQELDLISNRYKRITKIINVKYNDSYSELANSLYVGSFGRGTKIDDSDIDIVVVLPYSVYKRFDGYLYNGQSALLQEVKNVLKETFPRTDLKGDGQIISVNFSDGKKFEVLPAFINRDGWSFTYADSNNGGRWRVTDPRSEIEAVKEMDNATNGNYKRLCKMARAWKKHNDVIINGILIDTLAYRFMKDWCYKENGFIYYDYMTRDFMEYLKKIPKQGKYKVMGSDRFVDCSANFQFKAKVAYEKALEAIEYQYENPTLSSNMWRAIYGYRFPKL